MPTSFPYLNVARAYGVDYWRVLAFADLLDEWEPKQEDWYLDPWKVAVCLAWITERNRRFDITPKMVHWSAVNDITSWEPDPSTGSMKIGDAS